MVQDKKAVGGSFTAPVGGDARPIRQKDLTMLTCPVCHSGLQLDENLSAAHPHICCIGCGRGYPVIDGLPVLLPGAATLNALA